MARWVHFFHARVILLISVGIRYAAPPVGDLRFAAPEDPVTGNQTVVQADVVSFITSKRPITRLRSHTAWSNLHKHGFKNQ